MVRRIEALILAYDLFCRTRGNRIAHGFAVPVIFWSVMALAYSLPLTRFFGPYIPNLLVLALPVVLLFYISLSVTLAFGVAAFALFSWVAIVQLDLLIGLPVGWVGTAGLWAGLIMVVVGQNFERKRRRSPRTQAVLYHVRLANLAPLIAPLWLVSLICRKAEIRY